MGSVKNIQTNYSIATQGRNITVNRIANSSGNSKNNYTLVNAIGQVIVNGMWNFNTGSLNIAVPHSGKFILCIGKEYFHIQVMQ